MNKITVIMGDCDDFPTFLQNQLNDGKEILHIGSSLIYKGGYQEFCYTALLRSDKKEDT